MSGERLRLIFALGILAWLAIVAAVIIPLLDEDTGGGALEAPPLPPDECPGLELGVNSTLAFDRDAARRAETLAAIRETLGADIVRDTLLWHRVEPEEGERDWSSPDDVVEGLRSAGIEPLMIVLGSPSWANEVPESTPGHYLHVPPRGPALDAWLERYSDFLADAVERYQGVVRRWEIWNEPNLVDFWRPRPDPLAYVQVYETLRATILEVDPEAEVALGGLAGLTAAVDPNVPGFDFLGFVTRAGVPLDNVAIHSYPTNDHPPDVHIPGENNFDDIQRTHDVLEASGAPASIWLTEFGWSSAAIGESQQAQNVDRSLTMLESLYPFVEVATYFAERDRPPQFLHGLLDVNFEPKEAAAAFRRHADLAALRCAQREG